MKKLFNLLAVITLSLFTFSCSKDDDTLPPYFFLDRNLQGEIDGQNFTLGFGAARYYDINKSEFYIDLYDVDEEGTDPCNIYSKEVKATFTVPAKVGLYPLRFRLKPDDQTVILYNPEKSLNIIVALGAIDIISISETEVVGRLDARESGPSGINGNFRIPICQ